MVLASLLQFVSNYVSKCCTYFFQLFWIWEKLLKKYCSTYCQVCLTNQTRLQSEQTTGVWHQKQARLFFPYLESRCCNSKPFYVCAKFKQFAKSPPHTLLVIQILLKRFPTRRVGGLTFNNSFPPTAIITSLKGLAPFFWSLDSA